MDSEIKGKFNTTNRLTTVIIKWNKPNESHAKYIKKISLYKK